MILIVGGGSSGKSAYAEGRIAEIIKRKQCPAYYIATMRVFGPEEERIVERHRRMRHDKGLITVEQPFDLIECMEKIQGSSAALLECASNLCANEMFRDGCIYDGNEVAEKICTQAEMLDKHLCELIVVSNNIFEDMMQYDDVTKGYIRSLGMINRRLAKASREVWEVTAGIPVRIV